MSGRRSAPGARGWGCGRVWTTNAAVWWGASKQRGDGRGGLVGWWAGWAGGSAPGDPCGLAGRARTRSAAGRRLACAFGGRRAPKGLQPLQVQLSRQRRLLLLPAAPHPRVALAAGQTPVDLYALWRRAVRAAAAAAAAAGGAPGGCVAEPRPAAAGAPASRVAEPGPAAAGALLLRGAALVWVRAAGVEGRRRLAAILPLLLLVLLVVPLLLLLLLVVVVLVLVLRTPVPSGRAPAAGAARAVPPGPLPLRADAVGAMGAAIILVAAALGVRKVPATRACRRDGMARWRALSARCWRRRPAKRACRRGPQCKLKDASRRPPVVVAAPLVRGALPAALSAPLHRGVWTPHNVRMRRGGILVLVAPWRSTEQNPSELGALLAALAALARGAPHSARAVQQRFVWQRAAWILDPGGQCRNSCAGTKRATGVRRTASGEMHMSNAAIGPEARGAAGGRLGSRASHMPRSEKLANTSLGPAQCGRSPHRPWMPQLAGSCRAAAAAAVG